MLFKLMPALLKCDLVPLRPGRVLDRTFDHHFSAVLDLVFGPRFWSSSVRVFAGISVFSGFGVLVGTPFRTSLDPCFRPCFWALGNPTMLPVVQKFLGRVFAHRE
jgi:hypothetical protein